MRQSKSTNKRNEFQPKVKVLRFVKIRKLNSFYRSGYMVKNKSVSLVYMLFQSLKEPDLKIKEIKRH